jgi:GNAT superfamily N-acetyltransferase
MEIISAKLEDADTILSLQKLAYQSEAALYNDYSIPPLTQTIEQIKAEFDRQVFLKAVQDETIVGSVRAYADGPSCYVGRLIVHPDWQRKGIGSKLLTAIEGYFLDVNRFELFTGTRSVSNIRLYARFGYKPFKEKAISKSVTLVYMEKTVKIA